MAMKLGKDTGSLINNMYSRVVNTPMPEVGMGATELCWTDRRAMTIVEVFKIGKATAFAATRDSVMVVKGSAMDGSAEYSYATHWDGYKTYWKEYKGKWVQVYKKEKTGRWNKGDHYCLVGVRDEYHDPCF